MTLPDDNVLTEKLLEASNEEPLPSPLAVPKNTAGDYDDEPPTFRSDNQTIQNWTRGEKQESSSCRDAPLAILFYVQFASVAFLAFRYGLPAVRHEAHHNQQKEGDNDDEDYLGVLYLALVAGASSTVVSALSLTVMAQFSKLLIWFSLLYSIGVSLFMAMVAAMYGNVLGSVMGFMSASIAICYTLAVRDRIPFAVANIHTALVAVRSNFGVIALGYVGAVLTFGWSLLWVLAYTGLISMNKGSNDQCPDGKGENCQELTLNVGFLFLLLLSLYWTEQVIQNTIHVVVAGTVGTWWFDPTDASSCCSSAIRDSFVRATTTSFGSICFGSLISSIIQALRAIAEQARQDENDGAEGILLCLVDCCLALLQGIVEYFNKWAYIYIGLYGYSYIEAGKKVTALFQQRGWQTIINDNLVSNALSLMSVSIGLLTGCIGIVVDLIMPEWLEGTGESSKMIAFIVGFVIGLFVAFVMMSVVDSAVNTVVVCVAEAPAEFAANYPDLSREMKDAWSKVYDIRI